MRALLLALFVVGCTSTKAGEPAPAIALTLEEAQAMADRFSEMGATILLLQKQVEHYRIKSGCV